MSYRDDLLESYNGGFTTMGLEEWIQVITAGDLTTDLVMRLVAERDSLMALVKKTNSRAKSRSESSGKGLTYFVVYKDQTEGGRNQIQNVIIEDNPIEWLIEMQKRSPNSRIRILGWKQVSPYTDLVEHSAADFNDIFG
jgi:hypothetical protein